MTRLASGIIASTGAFLGDLVKQVDRAAGSRSHGAAPTSGSGYASVCLRPDTARRSAPEKGGGWPILSDARRDFIRRSS